MSSLFNSSTTYDPIYLLLNADDEEERDELTNRWKDNKLAELNFIGIVGALLAGVLTSTGSWPNILPDGATTPWNIRSCWFCGILLSLLSVLTAAQQSIRLHRLAGHRNATRNIRRLLKQKHRGPNGQLLPRRAQVYTWQLSAMFLTLSVICMIGGMFVLIWSSTGYNSEEGTWWDGEAGIAVTFTAVAILAGFVLIAEQVTLYSFRDNDDTDGNDTSGPNDAVGYGSISRPSSGSKLVDGHSR